MIRDRVKDFRTRVETRVRQELSKAKQRASAAGEALSAASESIVQVNKGPSNLETSAPEPPVVARLMVEIRSDGSRTIARGALVDEQSGERVALEANGATPLELAGQLAKTMMTLPFTAGQFARARVNAQRAIESQSQPPKPSDEDDT